MITCYISMGSNIYPDKNMNNALKRLYESFHIINISKLYQSKPILKKYDSPYLNAAIEVTSNLTPFEIKFNVLRKIEKEIGRIRTQDKYKSRKIDLDLVIYGNQIIEDLEYDIMIPDPEIAKYPHLILPLAEIAPDFVHPELNITLKIIAKKFTSNENITIYGSFSI